MANIGHPTPRLHHTDPIAGLLEVGRVVQSVMQGKLNNAASVTLTANDTTTAVTDERVGANSVVTFMPTTANAAAEIGNGTMYVSARGDGTFTITHANNAQADRTFSYVLGG